MNFRIRAAFTLALALASSASQACGYCVEDRIASVYDHAMVSQALSRQHQVAFFALKGPLAASSGQQQRIARIALTAKGVDPGSARVAIETAVLAVAFDPRATPLAAVEASLQSKLALQALSVQRLRVIDKAGELKVPRH
jgi:hypothetical protein